MATIDGIHISNSYRYSSNNSNRYSNSNSKNGSNNSLLLLMDSLRWVWVLLQPEQGLAGIGVS